MNKIAPALFLGAGLVVALAGPWALHVAKASPQPALQTKPQVSKAADNEFGPVCKAAELVDSRPDPAWVVASYAHDNCVAPIMPVRLDGYSATREQIVAGMAAAKRYGEQANAYQMCIANFVAQRRAEAGKTKKPLETALITIENHRIITSQEDQKKANVLIAAAIEDFNEYGSECL